MRRTTAAVVGTLAGTVVLVGARFGSSAMLQARAGEAREQTAVPAGAIGPEPSQTEQLEPQTADSPPESPSPKPKSKTTHSASPTAAAGKAGGQKAGSLVDGTYKGTAAPDSVFGTVQVTLTVKNGRATDITATYPTLLASKEINERATAIMRREALAAQSADIDSVSGATYSSIAYKESLATAFKAAKP
jgi:uncharacterized protein with FMN-binding domain